MDADLLLETLGARIRSLRGALGFTLKGLAERAEISARFLVQLESGTANVSVRKLAALARALGTTPAELLSGPGGDPETPVIALLGLRGAGKSTIGKRLARRLRVPFVELDRRIERGAGLSLDEIFALHGQDYYRRLERDALEALLAEDRPAVVATGGGIVTSPGTFAFLRRRALTVWLRAEAEDHWNRVVQQGDRRPMADNPEAMAELRRLLAERQPLYAEATHTIDTSRLLVDEAVLKIEQIITDGNPWCDQARARGHGNVSRAR